MPEQIIKAARDFWGVIAGIVGLAAWELRYTKIIEVNLNG